MKLSEIQDLIKFVSKSGVSEVELETKEIKIVIRTPKSAPQPAQVVMQPAAMMAAPVQQPVAVASQPAAQAASGGGKGAAAPPADDDLEEADSGADAVEVVGGVRRTSVVPVASCVSQWDSEIRVGRQRAIRDVIPLQRGSESYRDDIAVLTE